jgi:hypothetical protein
MRSMLTEMHPQCVQAYMTRISVLVSALNMSQNYIHISMNLTMDSA